jgi:hypothetical protein
MEVERSAEDTKVTSTKKYVRKENQGKIEFREFEKQIRALFSFYKLPKKDFVVLGMPKKDIESYYDAIVEGWSATAFDITFIIGVRQRSLFGIPTGARSFSQEEIDYLFLEEIKELLSGSRKEE